MATTIEIKQSPLYVFVAVTDYLASDVLVFHDKKQALDFAENQASTLGWENEEHRDVSATPGHEALIYFNQEEKGSAESHISVFEAIAEPK